MNVVVVSVGSSGDIHPFLAVALGLRDRGHRVSFVTSPYHAPLLRRVGLPLLPVGTVEQFEQATAHPALWRPHGALAVLAKIIGESTSTIYHHVAQEASRQRTIVVAHPLALGARVAHETHGIPLVTMHLAPAAILSVEAPAVASPWIGSPEVLPKSLRRLGVSLADRLADLAIASDLNLFRAELGLAPVRHVARHWWHSPQCVIGLFPEWFAAPQRDWPKQLKLTGFPLYDESGVSSAVPELEAFLDEAAHADDLPIAFAPGSGNRQAGRFFSAAADACRRLGRRGILLTRYTEHLPSRLPRGVRHFEYAPFSAVLPRVAALVHHGGIGTSAQALAAGIPQLVMPMSFDQPDNAARLVHLGVASVLPPVRFNGGAVARQLATLLRSAAVHQRCAEAAQKFEGADPISRTCDLIEGCER